MTETTNVRLVRNDANDSSNPTSSNQWFNLKCKTVDTQIGNNMVARAILSSAGDLAGGDPVLNTETYQLQGIRLAGVDAADYPDDKSSWYETTDSQGNTLTIPQDNHEQRMEAALRHAAKEWGPDATNGFDQLVWNDQSIAVVITSISTTESASQPAPGQYMVDIELEHVDAYVG